VGLVFLSSLVPVSVSYDSQKSVCNIEYAIQLNPLQTKSNNCAVLQKDWLALSVESNLNVTLSISLVKVGGGQVTLFNNTNTSLNASFPLVYSGAIVSVLYNGADNVSEVNGSLSVMSSTLENTTSVSTIYPYRTVGEGLVTVGVLAILLAVWNPALSTPVERIPIAKRIETPN